MIMFKKKTVDVEEFNKVKQMVHTIAENQTKIMRQIVDVQKELKQTIDLLHATNENLEIQMSINKMKGPVLSELNAS